MGVIAVALAFSSSSILLMFCVDPEAARILASSSTSAKLSCFTAAMEYAHTPTTNAAIVTPVMAFRALKGARARSKPGDICWIPRKTVRFEVRREPRQMACDEKEGLNR